MNMKDMGSQRCIVLGVVVIVAAFVGGWVAAGRSIPRAPVSNAGQQWMDVRGTLSIDSTESVWVIEQYDGGHDMLLMGTRQVPPDSSQVFVNGRMVKSIKINGVTVRLFVDCMQTAP